MFSNIYINFQFFKPFQDIFIAVNYKFLKSNEIHEILRNTLILPSENLEINNAYKIFYEKNSTILDFFEINLSNDKENAKDLRESQALNSNYIACSSLDSSNKCKELFKKQQIPAKGGLISMSKDQLNRLIFSISFISNIKFSKAYISGYESFRLPNENNSISLVYKRKNFPFEDDYIDEIRLKCGDIDYKLLERGFLMNNNIEYGFQIYYLKKSYNHTVPKAYYSHMYLEIKAEDDENISLADNLMKNLLWSKVQCFNANEHMNIKLYYKQENIDKINKENVINPDIFLSCRETFDEILTKFPSFQSKNELIGLCPQNCIKILKQKEENKVFGQYIYLGKSSICLAAIDNGLINDFYSGYVKFSWYNDNNNGNFFIFETLIGKISNLYNPASLLKIIRNNEISSYFRSFLEISDRNRADLTNIPTELLSKISETMNQNSKEIIQQNYNIEELWKENAVIYKKIEEIEKGENGIGNLTRKIQFLEESLNYLKENINSLIVNQENSHQIYQREIENQRLKTQNSFNLARNSSEFIEDFSNVCYFLMFFLIIFFFSFLIFFSC